MRENLFEARGGTMCLAKAGLVEGTNANTIKIASTDAEGVHYAIDGILYHKADTDNIAMNALAVQAADTVCLYAVCLNAAGDLSLVKGEEVLSTALTAGTAVLEYPDAGSTSLCVIGYVKITTVAVTFTSGTTDLGASGITDVYYDVMCPPARPRTS